MRAWWDRGSWRVWATVQSVAFALAATSAIEHEFASLIFSGALWYLAGTNADRAIARRDRQEREKVLDVLAEIGWSDETLAALRRKLDA